MPRELRVLCYCRSRLKVVKVDGRRLERRKAYTRAASTGVQPCTERLSNGVAAVQKQLLGLQEELLLGSVAKVDGGCWQVWQPQIEYDIEERQAPKRAK